MTNNIFEYNSERFLYIKRMYENLIKINVVIQKSHWDFRQRTEMEWGTIECNCFMLQNLIFDPFFIDYWKNLSSDYQDDSIIDKAFEDYVYSILLDLQKQTISHSKVNPYNWLIWDDYGIEMFDNIKLLSVDIADLKFEKDEMAIEYIKDCSGSKFYILERENCGESINAILRIRKRFEFFKEEPEEGYLSAFSECDLYKLLTTNDFKPELKPDHIHYKEICQYVDFKRNRISGSASCNTIDGRIEIGGGDYQFYVKNNIDSVFLHLKISGNSNFKKKVESVYKEQVEKERRNRDSFITFDEAKHTYTYTLDGKILQSVTNIVENCFPKFDAELHAKYTAAKMGITPEKVIMMWEQKGKESRELGTAMHKKIENYYKGQDSWEDDSYRLFKMFAEKVKLEPYRTEWAVYDLDHIIAGTIDFVDYQNGEYTIYDWKRSDKIIANGMPVKVSKYQEKGLYPLEHLENCAYYHYALQLSLYKFILERNYNMKISKLRLGIFHPTYDKPYVLEMPYLENEVNTLMGLRSEVIM